ncbi:MAG TPA: helix-turn-helix domain-containing protein [Pseudonocardiaceae bacterium]|nr:helix-turn-helix domain-containing protein [Pseudonocardiaceae bacterium]
MSLDHPATEALRIEDVLAALNHPARLQVVRTLAGTDELTCQAVLPDMTKSSASHHWRMLRQSGIVEQRREGRYLYMKLRKADLDSRFPGLLDAVIKG